MVDARTRKTLTDTVSIRVSEARRYHLEKRAKRDGMSLSAWILRALAEFEVMEGMTPEQFGAYQDAAKVLAELRGKDEGKR